MEEFIELQKELLKHRYLYYELGKTEINDYKYDMMERKSYKVAKKLGFRVSKFDGPTEREKDHVHWMVGFDYDHKYADEAIKRAEKLDFD